jgi:predicted phosphodiesterase
VLRVLLVSLVLALGLLLSQPVSAQIVLSPEDNKAKQEIIDALSKAVDHRWSQYDMINVSRSYDNSSFTVYNQSGFVPEPPIVVVPPVVEPPVNETTNVTTPEPTPEPITNETIKVALVGDLDGNEVVDAVAASKSDYNIALGDLGYDSSLSWFKSVWGKLQNSECVIGNHDSPEDGSESIYREAKDYCGDIWTLKVANNTVFIGFNTNGNLQTELATAQSYLLGSQMDGVKNIVLVSHKPCATPPGSHHGVESNVKAFCDGVKSNLPAGVNLYLVSGHNHFMSQTSDGKSFVSGAGGRSHYEGSTGNGWNYFNNNDDGFLQMQITNGNIGSFFYGVNGGLIH